jgi:hypothetical protein
METEIPEENERKTAPTDIEWEHRVLCSDGNCIGVIGPDGRCKECGKNYEGTLPEDHFSEKEGPSPEDVSFETEDPSAEDISTETEDPSLEDFPYEAAGPDDWQNRVLCSDGNCIGVIGPDGRCKECGKPYEG